MKRQKLIRHIESHGCNLLRDAGKHTVYVNSANHRTSSVPRHTEINDFLCWKICRDLDIPKP